MAAELRGDDEQWLLFIDQFEQVFTRCADARVRAAFLEALTRLAQAKLSEVKIVLAMRADFLGQLTPYAELVSLVEQGLHVLTDLSPSGLRAAIEQPAARHGVVFEAGLVEQIIKDVHQRPGALPLLQYTLDLVWNRDDDLNDRTLNTVTYQSAFLDAGVELHERRSLEQDERRLRKLQALQRELDDLIERGRLLLLAGRPTEAAVLLQGAYERGSQHPMLPYLLRQAMLHVERVHAVLLGHTGPSLASRIQNGPGQVL